MKREIESQIDGAIESASASRAPVGVNGLLEKIHRILRTNGVEPQEARQNLESEIEELDEKIAAEVEKGISQDVLKSLDYVDRSAFWEYHPREDIPFRPTIREDATQDDFTIYILSDVRNNKKTLLNKLAKQKR